MAKMRNKRIIGPDRVVRVSWDADHDHEAWMDWANGTPPSRETHPDAFYRVTTPAYPVRAGYCGSSRGTTSSGMSSGIW
jgi:hypothetical protein